MKCRIFNEKVKIKTSSEQHSELKLKFIFFINGPEEVVQEFFYPKITFTNELLKNKFMDRTSGPRFNDGPF